MLLQRPSDTEPHLGTVVACLFLQVTGGRGISPCLHLPIFASTHFFFLSLSSFFILFPSLTFLSAGLNRRVKRWRLMSQKLEEKEERRKK